MVPPPPPPALSAGSGLSDEDLITGEAVALELPAATLGVRAVSGLIDLTLEGLLLAAIILLLFTAVSGSDGALIQVAALSSFVLVLVGLPVATETLTRGRTLGKWVMGLRAVRDDAGPLSFRHAFMRGLVGFVEIWVLSGVPALFTAIVHPRGKRLGDLVAGTYVVRDRFRLRMRPPTPVPPHLAGWVRNADLAELPLGLGVAVRAFLGRVDALTPAARAGAAAQLAAQVAPFVAPPPPPGTHPEHFLAAVAGERRDRDLTRLTRDDQSRRRAEHLLRRADDDRPGQETP